LQIILNIFYGLYEYATIKSCISFSFFNIFLFSHTYLSISHSDACTRGCLFTNRDVIKLIMREATLKQIFRFSQELGGLLKGEIFCKKKSEYNTIFTGAGYAAPCLIW